MSKISVLTLVSGRKNHLINMIKGLMQQTMLPDELVIAYMQAEPHADLPDTPFPIHHVIVNEDPMPLAKARNKAAETAQFENLIFLDVDCIPSSSVVKSYSKALDEKDGVFMGEVFYLPKDAVGNDIDYQTLNRLGHIHPLRPILNEQNGYVREEAYERLWGLSFAIRKSTYFKVGGMCENYVGYGGEETDYAFLLKRHEIAMFWCPNARCYHQYHPRYSPPYQHFYHILFNAKLFKDRMAFWPMSNWLDQFVSDGFIKWNRECDTIKILKAPNEEDIANAYIDDDWVV